MSESLPLFPLGTVLFPGLLLPLHIFEERYRQLVRDLLAGPAPRRFGVIAIRKGRETGIDGISALYQIGCTATVRQVTERDDGRFDLVTAGTQRFRLADLDDSKPYLQGKVDLLPEQAGDQAAAGDAAQAVQAVQAAFRTYLSALAARGATQLAVPDLPADPVLLSYLVAASMIIDLSDKQALLAEPDAAGRLAAEHALLSRETTMLRSLTSMPAPDLRYSPYSPN
jgi:Lon protease-like protein